jgi:hypothetical protein
MGQSDNQSLFFVIGQSGDEIWSLAEKQFILNHFIKNFLHCNLFKPALKFTSMEQLSLLNLL